MTWVSYVASYECSLCSSYKSAASHDWPGIQPPQSGAAECSQLPQWGRPPADGLLQESEYPSPQLGTTCRKEREMCVWMNEGRVSVSVCVSKFVWVCVCVSMWVCVSVCALTSMLPYCWCHSQLSQRNVSFARIRACCEVWACLHSFEGVSFRSVKCKVIHMYVKIFMMAAGSTVSVRRWITDPLTVECASQL